MCSHTLFLTSQEVAKLKLAQASREIEAPDEQLCSSLIFTSTSYVGGTPLGPNHEFIHEAGASKKSEFWHDFYNIYFRTFSEAH
jgi:hypothetical protein